MSNRLKRIYYFLKLANKSEAKNAGRGNKLDFKLAGEFKDQCKIYNIEEESEYEYLEEETGLDYYEILEDIDNLFKSVGIRISRNENFYEACINKDGKVMGASVLSKEVYGEEPPRLRFSVAVSPEAQGGGIGRELVNSIVENNKNNWVIEAWVVNPNMATLLESLGFESQGGGEWSQNNPFMELPGSGNLDWIK